MLYSTVNNIEKRNKIYYHTTLKPGAFKSYGPGFKIFIDKFVLADVLFIFMLAGFCGSWIGLHDIY